MGKPLEVTDEKLMPGFLVRWTKNDVENNVPQRLKTAIEESGAEQAPLTRTLLLKWLEDIERRGPAQVNYAVARVNERPAREYGGKRKRARRRK